MIGVSLYILGVSRGEPSRSECRRLGSNAAGNGVADPLSVGLPAHLRERQSAPAFRPAANLLFHAVRVDVSEFEGPSNINSDADLWLVAAVSSASSTTSGSSSSRSAELSEATLNVSGATLNVADLLESGATLNVVADFLESLLSRIDLSSVLKPGVSPWQCLELLVRALQHLAAEWIRELEQRVVQVRVSE